MLHNLWKCLFCLNEFDNFVAFPRRYHRRHDVSCHSDVRQQRLMPIGEGMGTRHIEGVYLTLCSWLSETSQTLDTVNEPSNGRCLRVWLYHGQWSIVPMCIFLHIGFNYSMWRHIYIISAWALALSVLQYRAMRRPQRVGQTTSGSHAFLYVSHLTLFLWMSQVKGNILAKILSKKVNKYAMWLRGGIWNPLHNEVVYQAMFKTIIRYVPQLN